MKSKLVFALSLVLVVTGAVNWSWTKLPGAGASSHREAPLIAADPTVDNTDVYVFRSPDAAGANTVTLISNFIPFEEPAGGPNFYHFSDNARYLIKVDRDGDALEDIAFEFTFTTQIQNTGTFLYNTNVITSPISASFNYRQTYTVAQILGNGASATRTVLASNLVMPPDHIGPRSEADYDAIAAQAIYPLSNLSGGGSGKVFVGQRADPFFVDVGSIFDLLGLRPFNQAHLIKLPNEPGKNSLYGFNVHAIALQLPIQTLTGSGCPATPAAGDISNQACVFGVWSTAERPATTVRSATSPYQTASGNFVQVSRLGMPLTNEVVIDLARKDLWNATPPSGDAVFASRVLTPEVGTLIPVLYPGVQVPPPPRTDLATVFLSGIPGVNQQAKSGLGAGQVASEQLRINVAIPPTAGVCQGNVLGATAGDNAGFPNGRRLEDDVVDIELRAIAGSYGVAQSLTGIPATFNTGANAALGDGANKIQNNLKPCLPAFPYVPSPWSGYASPHALADNGPPPPVVPGATSLLMFGTGLVGLGSLAWSRLRGRRERRGAGAGG